MWKASLFLMHRFNRNFTAKTYICVLISRSKDRESPQSNRILCRGETPNAFTSWHCVVPKKVVLNSSIQTTKASLGARSYECAQMDIDSESLVSISRHHLVRTHWYTAEFSSTSILHILRKSNGVKQNGVYVVKCLQKLYSIEIPLKWKHLISMLKQTFIKFLILPKLVNIDKLWHSAFYREVCN